MALSSLLEEEFLCPIRYPAPTVALFGTTPSSAAIAVADISFAVLVLKRFVLPAVASLVDCFGAVA